VQVNCSEDKVKVQPRTGIKQNNNNFVQTEMRIKIHKLLKQKSSSDNGSGSNNGSGSDNGSRSDNGSGSNSTDGFSTTK